MSNYHQPVLLREVLSLLTDGVSSGWVVDCTLGGGGHSEAILDATPPGVCVLGVDRDPEARGVHWVAQPDLLVWELIQ